MSHPRPDPLLAPFRDAYDRRFEAPAGQDLVGTLSANAPLELIVAAGLTPRRLFSNPASSTPAADVLMEPVFDGAIRSLFDQFLSDRFANLPLVVCPRSSEGHLQLYYFLQEAARLNPALALPELHLFDLLKTAHWGTRLYVHAQLATLRSTLEHRTGKAIADASLVSACQLLNLQRRQFARVNALRRESAPRLSGSEMLQIVGAAGVLSPAEHIDALDALLAGASHLSPREGIRVMLKGSAQDDLRLCELIESCGAIIVADDHPNGEQVFEGLVDEAMSPMNALAQKYHRHSTSLRSLPRAAEDMRFLDMAREARVQGVIFFFEEHDDTLGWDHPAQKKLLDAQGIPSLCLRNQCYRHPDRALRHALIGTWLRGLSMATAS